MVEGRMHALVPSFAASPRAPASSETPPARSRVGEPHKCGRTGGEAPGGRGAAADLKQCQESSLTLHLQKLLAMLSRKKVVVIHYTFNTY